MAVKVCVDIYEKMLHKKPHENDANIHTASNKHHHISFRFFCKKHPVCRSFLKADRKTPYHKTIFTVIAVFKLVFRSSKFEKTESQ